ncbi:hypothetical protein HOT82_gp005 [Gordonia phage Ronaldo]|uniref:Uncharacterized protein n=3 Tax=Ronaldovirus ronaldo TaxID=2734270 RepID=A0A6B9LGE7_9CAUD|nr:hypothetical protein HOT82_gp005 [Gordonia phage Ronaldo]AXN53569.1 hypothetical protein SEA_RONALDO_5 [Gordonia phage Ronaldo]QDH48346.1 hypothetical protein SEA_ZIKO_6 [Gordonia phage Ziko]QHB38125.1 hypothetical protein SEA_VOLT_5 [Gordonia phage Volt]
MSHMQRTVHTFICDRCDYEVEQESSLRPDDWSYFATSKSRYLIQGAVDGIAHELCPKCTESLDEWRKTTDG